MDVLVDQSVAITKVVFCLVQSVHEISFGLALVLAAVGLNIVDRVRGIGTLEDGRASSNCGSSTIRIVGGILFVCDHLIGFGAGECLTRCDRFLAIIFRRIESETSWALVGA